MGERVLHQDAAIEEVSRLEEDEIDDKNDVI